jgi:hypothetical protein
LVRFSKWKIALQISGLGHQSIIPTWPTSPTCGLQKPTHQAPSRRHRFQLSAATRVPSNAAQMLWHAGLKRPHAERMTQALRRGGRTRDPGCGHDFLDAPPCGRPAPFPKALDGKLGASTSEMRPPLHPNTRQKRRVSGSARFAALMKRRRSPALRYFRAPVGPYRLVPASACGRIAASRETEWPILFQHGTLRGSAASGIIEEVKQDFVLLAA